MDVQLERVIVRHGSNEWLYHTAKSYISYPCVSDGGVALCADNNGSSLGVYADKKLAEFATAHLCQLAEMPDTFATQISRVAISTCPFVGL